MGKSSCVRQLTLVLYNMAIHTPVILPGIYFITFTCHRWLNLIEKVNGYDLVYNWFNVLAKKQHTVTGYVIMPNHLHMLLYYGGGKQSLNNVIGNGKRFMAYEIINRLGAQNEMALLDLLKSAVKSKDKQKGQKHEVWIDSFDVKHCRIENFILQKLNYIHNNPCAGKWRLADDPIIIPIVPPRFIYREGKALTRLKTIESFCVLTTTSKLRNTTGPL